MTASASLTLSSCVMRMCVLLIFGSHSVAWDSAMLGHILMIVMCMQLLHVIRVHSIRLTLVILYVSNFTRFTHTLWYYVIVIEVSMSLPHTCEMYHMTYDVVWQDLCLCVWMQHCHLMQDKWLEQVSVASIISVININTVSSRVSTPRPDRSDLGHKQDR